MFVCAILIGNLMISRTRTPFDKLAVAEPVNVFLIDLMFISVIAIYTDVEGATCHSTTGLNVLTL